MTDIVFVHGAWVGPRCWDLWRQHFDAQGLKSIAPSWPGDERPYEQLRASPDPALASVGVAEIVEHYARIIQALPKPPLIIGHSFGGLVTQLLLARGLGSAGVAINPGPPRGVFPAPGAVKTSAPVLFTWGGWKKVLTISYENFVGGFVHELPENERRAAYEQHAIPTPGRPFFQVAFAPFNSATAIDFKAARAPLLITGGELDRTVPLSMNVANAKAYRKSPSVTELKVYPRSHWTIAEPGWEQVANDALAWAKPHLR